MATSEKSQARELADRIGIPRHMALRVVRGELTVQQALETLLLEERVERLVKEHGMDRGIAAQVARGTVALEYALFLRELRACPARQAERSVLVELFDSAEPADFWFHGSEVVRGRVVALGTYDFQVADLQGQRREWPKHDLELVSVTIPREMLTGQISTDPEVASRGLGPSTSYRDRFRSSKTVLFRHFRDDIPTEIVLRDGLRLMGHIGWFGKWELELRLDGPAPKPNFRDGERSVVVFRHALQSLRPAPEVSAKRVHGRKSTGAKSKKVGSRGKRKPKRRK